MTNPSTSRTELLAAISKRIEELVPDAGFWMKGKPIDFTLCDVLLALDRPPFVYACDSTGAFLMWKSEMKTGEFRYIGELRTNWNFRKDSLSDQSDETLLFLHSLLC